MVKNFEDSFIRLDRMYERDRHTDGWTPHDSIGHACIASRGKNDKNGMNDVRAMGCL